MEFLDADGRAHNTMGNGLVSSYLSRAGRDRFAPHATLSLFPWCARVRQPSQKIAVFDLYAGTITIPVVCDMGRHTVVLLIMALQANIYFAINKYILPREAQKNGPTKRYNPYSAIRVWIKYKYRAAKRFYGKWCF